jgi:hypothetical protein
MNGDGKLDIVVGFASAAQIAVLRGNGNGSFMAAISSGPSQARCIGLGDLNHDGKIDLFAIRPVDSRVSVHLGNGKRHAGSRVVGEPDPGEHGCVRHGRSRSRRAVGLHYLQDHQRLLLGQGLGVLLAWQRRWLAGRTAVPPRFPGTGGYRRR